MATANGEGPPPAGVTEAEVALYDRQIRLWGLEAQNRMRSAHVLIAPLTGVATEVVKNIVLSGIGRLTIADGTSVSEEDLGAGFFFRSEDVGSPRAATAPLQRIQQLNPLVKLQGIPERDALADEALVEELRPDVVVACAGQREALVKLNAACRRIGARFYATRAQGLGGFLFSDLGERYEYVTERSERGSTDKKKALWRQAFVPLADSLRVSWNRAALQPGEVLGAPVRQWGAGLWALWASWELGAEARSSSEAYAAALQQTAQRLLDAKGVDARSVFEKRGVDRATFFRAYAEATCAEPAAEFAPTCAVLGGILAQDLLNALSQREEPIVNWCVLDAARGLAQIHAIGTPAAEALAAPSDAAH